MPTTVPPPGESGCRWSLFARALEDILATPQHGGTPLSRLDNLRERPGEELDPDDPRSPRELVHREKVQRLIRSLREPGTFPLLSRDDLERIRRYFGLDDEESLRLQAAILATQAQRMVYERFGVKASPEKKRYAAAAALRAAELLLPTLIDAARQIEVVDMMAFDGTVGSLVVRKRRNRYIEQDEQTHISTALAEALDAIDRGMLALNLSYSASGYAEQLEQARAARAAFADALEQLDQQDAVLKSSEPWQFWHAEARSGYQDAGGRVANLERP